MKQTTGSKAKGDWVMFAKRWAWPIFLVAYAAFLIAWLLVKPGHPNFFPDETARMLVPRFILAHGMLPTGLELEVMVPQWGNSYALQPTLLSSLVAALFMWLTSFFTADANTLLTAARFISTLSIFFAVIFLHKTARLLFSSRIAWVMVILFAFLPQVLFISAYYNNDAITLFGSTLVLYGWAQAYTNDWDLRSALSVALGSVVILLSYYNAYGWLLLSALLVASAWFANRKEPGYNRHMLKLCCLAVGIMIVFAGGFFVRNALLHDGDILGRVTSAALTEERGSAHVKALLANTPLARGSSLPGMLRDGVWIPSTAKSFIAGFRYMDVFLPHRLYYLYYALFVAGFAGGLLGLIRMWRKNRSARKLVWYICLTCAVLIPIILSIWYSYSSDYQAQGRYIMPGLPAFALLLAKGYEVWLGFFDQHYRRLGTALTVLVCTGYASLCFYAYLFIYLPA